jgi:hypothetical protein
MVAQYAVASELISVGIKSDNWGNNLIFKKKKRRKRKRKRRREWRRGTK